MNGNEGYWGGGISIISQNFPKSLSILFHPLDSSISQTSPYSGYHDFFVIFTNSDHIQFRGNELALIGLEMNNVQSGAVCGMDVRDVTEHMVKVTNAADEHEPLVPPAQSVLI
jgi:hypothetical protein